MTVPPEWVHEFETWLNPASVIAAFVFPPIRVVIRRYRGILLHECFECLDDLSGTGVVAGERIHQIRNATFRRSPGDSGLGSSPRLAVMKIASSIGRQDRQADLN